MSACAQDVSHRLRAVFPVPPIFLPVSLLQWLGERFFDEVVTHLYVRVAWTRIGGLSHYQLAEIEGLWSLGLRLLPLSTSPPPSCVCARTRAITAKERGPSAPRRG